VVAAVFVVAEVVMVHRTPAQLSHSLLGNLGDPALIIWTLRWDGHAMLRWAFLRHPSSVFNAPIFSPAQHTLAYADDLLAIAPAYNALYAVTHNWSLSLNLLWLGELGLNMGATYSLARWLTRRTEAAVLAGLAAGFSAFVWSQVGHPQLQTLGLIPLGLLLLFKLLERPRLGLALGFGVVNVAVLLSAQYWAAIYMVSVAVILVGWLVIERAWPSPPLAQGLILAAVVTLLAAPTFIPYRQVERGEPPRPLVPVWSLHGRDLLRPTEGSYLYPGLSRNNAPGTSERHAFPGFVTMALALAGLGALAWSYRRSAGPVPAETPAGDANRARPPPDRRRFLVLLAVVGLVALVLAVGAPNGMWTPWRLLYDHVLGFNGIRVTARLAAVTLLAVAILAAAGLDAVMRRLPVPGLRLGVTAVACLAVLAELAGPLSWVTLPADKATLAVYHALAHDPPGVVAELPMATPVTPRWSFTEPVRMVWATIDWHPRLNGYSGYFPSTYPSEATVLATMPSPAAETLLRALHVRYLIIHVGKQAGWQMYTPAQAQQLVSQLGSGPVVTRYGPNYLVDLGTAAG
jgi:hypothetical protein